MTQHGAIFAVIILLRGNLIGCRLDLLGHLNQRRKTRGAHAGSAVDIVWCCFKFTPPRFRWASAADPLRTPTKIAHGAILLRDSQEKGALIGQYLLIKDPVLRNGASAKWNCAWTRTSVNTRPTQKTLTAPADGPARAGVNVPLLSRSSEKKNLSALSPCLYNWQFHKHWKTRLPKYTGRLTYIPLWVSANLSNQHSGAVTRTIVNRNPQTAQKLSLKSTHCKINMYKDCKVQRILTGYFIESFCFCFGKRHLS